MKAKIILTIGALALLCLPPAVSADVLYDQTTGTPGGLVASEIAGPNPDGNDCQAPPPMHGGGCFAADDFTVPPGPAWVVTGVYADGQGGVGDFFKFGFYTDQGGLPSGSGFLAPITGDYGAGERIGDGAIKMQRGAFQEPVAALDPGTYWLSFTATAPIPTSWFWRTQSPQTGQEAAWFNSVKQCQGTGTNWFHLATCGQMGPDLRFRVEGELLDRKFCDFKLGAPKRIPSGGLSWPATFPGYGDFKLTGTGGLQTSSHSVLKEHFLLKAKPKPSAKQKLKQAISVKSKVRFAFTRVIPGHDAPTCEKTLDVTLKKP
jgi:hypothetical protein